MLVPGGGHLVLTGQDARPSVPQALTPAAGCGPAAPGFTILIRDEAPGGG